MKFTATTSKIIKALSVVTRALAARSANSALEGVLFEADENSLSITASDGTITIHASLDVDITEPGKLLAPGKFLLETIKKLPDGEMEAHETGTGALSMSCMGSRITLSCRPVEDYPELPKVTDPVAFNMPYSLLSDMISETAFCVADDDPRPVLMGALFEVKGSLASMVATDGFRMALRRKIADGIPEGANVRAIVPKKPVIEISRLLTEKDDAEAEIRIDKNYIAVKIDDITLYSRLLDGEYISYERIIPRSFRTRVRISREEFAACVERASLIAREGKTNLIKIEIGENGMIVTSNSETADSYDEIDVQLDGEPISIAFNVKYLMDTFRAMSDEYVYLQFTTGSSPMTILPVNGEDYLYLVLPVRVAA